MATDFSLESVRQFMLAYEGKVTNHDLVKHYKAWLTHPTEKETARQKFKEYVNTLSSIKVEDGVKYLVLKKRFYPTFADPAPQNTASSGSSLLDEVMSSWTASQQQANLPSRRQLPPTPMSSSSSSYYGRPQQPPAYHQAAPPPPPPSYRAPPPPVRSDHGLPLPSDYGLPAPRQGLFHPPGPSSLTSYEQRQPYGQYQHYPPPQQQVPYNLPPPLPRRNEAPAPHMLSRSSSVMSNSPTSTAYSQQPYDLGAIGRSMSVQENLERHQPPPLPTRNNMAKEASPSLSSSSASMTSLSNSNSRKPSISDDKENHMTDSAIEKMKQTQEKISVKERTKTFNRMASEVELSSTGAVVPKDHAGSKKRKNSKSTRGSSIQRDELDSHDSSSISTLDQAAKQWMVCSAKGDYLSLVKMLREDPRLAKAKDFTSGYTALHWAAKHGNQDMVKLLAGNYSVNVNARSHGGYTPLHLACQFGHTEVFDLLVKAYGADSNLRDNSGKKPRQYLQLSAGNAMNIHMSNDTFRQLKDRRRNRNRQLADKNSGILRFGSLSVKVKKTTEAFNSYFGSQKAVHDSQQPYSLPTIGAASEEEDSSKMPPPKFAPIKKRRSKRAADFQPHSMSRSAPVTPHGNSPIKEEMRLSDSDSEYGFDSQWGTPQNR